MNHKTIIYKLIYHAFLDIRNAEQSGEPNTAALKLSEIFHNVPLQLNRVDTEGGDYEEILVDIRERAKRVKSEAWLDNVIQQL